VALQDTLKAHPCELDGGRPWPPTVLKRHYAHPQLT